MSAGQSSSKKNVAFQKQEVVTSAQTGTYTVTAAWANAGNGFSVTIPRAGIYRLLVECTINAQGPGGDVKVAIGRNGTNISETIRRVYSSDHNIFFPTHIETEFLYCAAGDTITLRALEDGAGSGSIYYAAGIAVGFIEAVLQNGVVPTIPADNLYSTTELNTGRFWTDGKPIYRRVFTGTTASAATTVAQALGVTVDTPIVNNCSLSVDTATYGWEPQDVSSDNGAKWFFTNSTQNTVDLYHNDARFYNRPYTLILEYTKV